MNMIYEPCCFNMLLIGGYCVWCVCECDCIFDICIVLAISTRYSCRAQAHTRTYCISASTPTNNQFKAVLFFFSLFNSPTLDLPIARIDRCVICTCRKIQTNSNWCSRCSVLTPYRCPNEHTHSVHSRIELDTVRGDEKNASMLK